MSFLSFGVCVLSPFYRQGDWGWKVLHNLSKVTKQVSSRAEVQIQAGVTPEFVLFLNNHLPFKWWAPLVAQTVKNLSAMQETWVWPLVQEDPLEKGMATHSSILARIIPRTEEPGGLQSMGSQSWTIKWLTHNLHVNCWGQRQRKRKFCRVYSHGVTEGQTWWRDDRFILSDMYLWTLCGSYRQFSIICLEIKPYYYYYFIAKAVSCLDTFKLFPWSPWMMGNKWRTEERYGAV